MDEADVRADYLGKLDAVARTKGRARLPQHWRGARVSLAWCRVGRDDAFALATGRQKRVSARARAGLDLAVAELDVSGSDLRGYALGAKTPLRAGLMRAVLSHCGLGAADVIGLFRALPSSMEALDVGGNDVGDEVVAAICAESPQALRQLHLVGLAQGSIGDAGAALLARTLASSTRLQTLDLGGNRIGDAGALAIADGLLRADPVLKDLGEARETGGDINVDVDADSDAIPNWPETPLWQLRTVLLARNDVTDVGAAVDLLLAAQRLPAKPQVSLHGNPVFDEAMLAILLLQKDDDDDETVPCPLACGAPGLRAHTLDRHLGFDNDLELCAARPRKCALCGTLLAAAKEDAHLALACTQRPWPCRFHCGKSLFRSDGNFEKPEIDLDPDVEAQELAAQELAAQELAAQELSAAAAAHEARSCTRVWAPCRLGCGKNVRGGPAATGQQARAHYESECAERTVPCPLAAASEVNCALVKARDLEAHMAEHRREHERRVVKEAFFPDAGAPPPRVLFGNRGLEGGGNALARSLGAELRELCASVALPAEARIAMERKRQEAGAKERRSLADALSLVREEKRVQARVKAARSLAVWRKEVPRACLHIGCRERVFERNFSAHIHACGHNVVECGLACGRAVKQKDKAKHECDECEMRIVECSRPPCMATRMHANEADAHDREHHRHHAP